MPRKSAHPYVVWRDGRPRFSPGPELRAAGHKGKDLRHDAGQWFTFAECVAWSAAFAEQDGGGGRARTRARNSGQFKQGQGSPNPDTRGFVYFLWVNDRIKIGFTRDPVRRFPQLSTGLGHQPGFVAVVPGTRADEKALHAALAGSRDRGEWFKPTLSVVRTIQRHLHAALGPLAAPLE